MMLPALPLCLDGFELGRHSLLRRNPPDEEGSVAVALPTVVSETQEHKGLRFSLSALSPVTGSEPPELVASCPRVIPIRTWPAVPETPAGTVQRLLGIESRAQDLG